MGFMDKILNKSSFLQTTVFLCLSKPLLILKNTPATPPNFFTTINCLSMSSQLNSSHWLKMPYFYILNVKMGFKEMIPLGTDDEGNVVGIEGFYLDDDELVFTNEKSLCYLWICRYTPEKTVRI